MSEDKVIKAFISYAYDSEEHKGWVRKLASVDNVLQEGCG